MRNLGTKFLALLLIIIMVVPMVSIFAQDGGAEVVLPEVDPLLVSGDIAVAGSSTVFPLTVRMAERFEEDGYFDTITVDSIGSGAGFERFCVETASDISNASRSIKDSEIEACAENGRDVLEFRVGTDALAVTVSAENDFVDSLTLAELAMIFDGTAQTWADINAEWPAEAIQIFSPGTDSGTFDFFVEAVLQPVHGDDAETAILSQEPQLSEDDNVLVNGVVGSPYAIGYFGYAYYLENADTLKVLNIEGVAPTAENVDYGSYPLARPLFIYSATSVLEEKPQVADFINYYLTYVNEEITNVGYFPASVDALTAAKINWLVGMGMEAPMRDDMGDDMGDMTETVLPAVDPLLVAGDIAVAGSSTVFPLTVRIAERFEEDGYFDTITVDSIGSGAGFERFCVETASLISNASRPIKDSEVEACAANGRNVLEFRVGTDALAVVVSAENDFVDALTLAELAMIFDGTAQTWADLNAEWPAEAIQLFSPGTDSGTFDFFVEAVLEPVHGDNAETAILSQEPQLSEDDNVLVNGVVGSPYAIGYFGYAYYLENADTLKVLNIDGVAPTAENVDNGSYPLARPLFIYSAVSVFEENPQVANFINYYLTYVNEEITNIGYFPASADGLEAARQTWIAGATAAGLME